MSRALVLAIGLTALLGAAARAAADPAALLSPRPRGWVVDQAGLLTPENVSELNRIGDAVHARDGAALAVLTVDTANGADPRSFATQVFNRWELGDRRRDNGLLLFIAIRDRAAEIVLGDGIDSDAEVAKSDRIMRDEIVARLRRGETAAGIVAGARACAAEFFGVAPQPLEALMPAGTQPANSGATSPPRSRRARNLFAYLPSVAGLGALGGMGWWITRVVARQRPRRCRKCRRPMTRLDEASDDAHLTPSEVTEERVGSVDYDVWLCAGCGAIEKLRFGRWFSRFSHCRKCGAVTTATTKRTLHAATVNSTGLMEIQEHCQHCGRQHTFTKTLPRVSESSSSSYSGSSGSSGGGGSSSGAGSSGRW